jgi:hypothetical protein
MSKLSLAHNAMNRAHERYANSGDDAFDDALLDEWRAAVDAVLAIEPTDEWALRGLAEIKTKTGGN